MTVYICDYQIGNFYKLVIFSVVSPTSDTFSHNYRIFV